MTATEPAVKREKAPRSVNYTLEVVDDLPEPQTVRRSPLEDALDAIKAKEEVHGRWVKIGEYENGTAASAAANVLRQRHGGSSAVEGWTIQPKRFDKEQADGSKLPLTGLFVRFTPDQIVDGAREEWDRKEAERKAALDKARKEREAVAANGGEQTKASGQTASQPKTQPQNPAKK